MTAADPSPYLPFLLSGAASALDARAWLLGRHHATLAAAATRGPLDDHLHAYDRWSRPDLPEGVVIHLDARCGGAKALDALDSARGFLRPGGSVSSHGVIAVDGEVFCPIPVDRPSWHTGDPDGKAGPAPDYNRLRLGVDLSSPGPLQRWDGCWYRVGTVAREGLSGRWLRWKSRDSGEHWLREPPLATPSGSAWPASWVLDLGDDREQRAYGQRYWHLCPPAQILGLAVFLRAATLACPGIDPERIVRHANLAGNRCDCGPSVPLEQLREWACGTCDLEAAVRDAAAGPEGWAGWLLGQWRRPTGLIVRGIDDRIPGRRIEQA